MQKSQKKGSKAERRMFWARALCLTLAVVMIGATLMAALLSQVF